MYQHARTTECTSLDVASKSWMPLNMQVSTWIPTCKSCLSVHTHMYAVIYCVKDWVCLCCSLYGVFFWFGCSHQQDIIVKSFPGSFLLALSCWLGYCNRDCSLPLQSFRWWLGGETLNPFLRDSLGLLVASVIQDFQVCCTYSLQWQSLGKESSLNDFSTHCGLLSLDALKLCLTSTSGQGED